MRASALALVLAAAFLAGCGGHSGAAKPNGEASRPAGRVLADARAAATNASSAHVSGTVRSSGTPITLDLRTSRNKGAKGTISTSGLPFDLVRIGDTAYVRGSDAFYEHFAGPRIAQLVHGKWLEAPITQGRFGPVAPLTSIGLLLGEVSAHHGKLVNDGTTTYEGTKVVAIRDTSDDSKLYVAATGRPYPVAIVGGRKSQSGKVAFDDWNEHVSLSAPAHAIDLSELGG